MVKVTSFPRISIQSVRYSIFHLSKIDRKMKRRDYVQRKTFVKQHKNTKCKIALIAAIIVLWCHDFILVKVFCNNESWCVSFKNIEVSWLFRFGIERFWHKRHNFHLIAPFHVSWCAQNISSISRPLYWYISCFQNHRKQMKYYRLVVEIHPITHYSTKEAVLFYLPGHV